MKKLKVIKIDASCIYFENDVTLYSDHDQVCCESHELNLEDLQMSDFEGLEFDLSNDDFFKRIPDYGIELIPIKGYSIKIAGHGSNNGYYSDNLDLVISQSNKCIKRYDITECQDVTY